MSKKDYKMNVKVKIDCIGCGLCCSVCPDVFELKAGRAFVKESKTESSKNCVKEAIMNCPVEAIEIKEIKN
jgi:ferredoxin